MKERREIERYKLQVPAKIEAIGAAGKKEKLSLQTRDISANGAFFTSEKPVSEGIHVSLELVLSMEKFQQLIGKKSRIELKIDGTVIRSDPEGIAVSFDKKYKIRALTNLNNNMEEK